MEITSDLGNPSHNLQKLQAQSWTTMSTAAALNVKVADSLALSLVCHCLSFADWYAPQAWGESEITVPTVSSWMWRPLRGCLMLPSLSVLSKAVAELCVYHDLPSDWVISSKSLYCGNNHNSTKFVKLLGCFQSSVQFWDSCILLNFQCW